VDPQWLSDLATTARILKLDDIRKAGQPSAADGQVPNWLVEELDLWILVPLIKSQRLIGLVALGRPLIDRDLDWEDFDLLKVIAQQAAVHLSDAQSHAELEDSRRFDEFNRRFAFIVHDIKNVVSQLALVSSNAEAHGANPKFQASMVKTLGNATSKMTTLLSRLTPDRMAAEPVFGALEPGQLLQRLAIEAPSMNPILVEVDCPCTIWADEERLLESLGHLLTNAIEASPPGAPVKLCSFIQGNMVFITVEDQGCGMSANFIRKELYKPFFSTKDGGFGIGAAEARGMILAMGGFLDVFSIEGEGTKFSAIFPIHHALHNNGA
jgi:putative PEP-CTERM system histidine kinase